MFNFTWKCYTCLDHVVASFLYMCMHISALDNELECRRSPWKVFEPKLRKLRYSEVAANRFTSSCSVRNRKVRAVECLFSRKWSSFPPSTRGLLLKRWCTLLGCRWGYVRQTTVNQSTAELGLIRAFIVRVCGKQLQQMIAIHASRFFVFFSTTQPFLYFAVE